MAAAVLAVTFLPGAAAGAGTAAPAAFQTLPLETLAGRSAGAAAGEAVLPEHTTEPFSLLGVTWADPAKAVAGAIQVRTRARGTGQWSDWQTLESDGSGPGDARGATDPLWVGESDGVQARVTAGDTLPAGLRVDLINPDVPAPPAPPKTAPRKLASPKTAPQKLAPLKTAPQKLASLKTAPQKLASLKREPLKTAPQKFVGQEAAPRGRAAGMADRPASAATRLERAAVTVPLPTRPVPRMVTRSGWGANEAMVKDAPEYTGPTKVFFVHHTATGNGYRCSQSASIVRGIQAYQVRSKGWDDIGYNFLVDKCGTIFEGRAGGVGRAVLGAHTLGFNTDASAIAVIGTYDSVRVSPSVATAIATVAAYKLGAYGNSPTGRVVLTSGGSNRYPQGAQADLYRISGHRDAGRTDCPGDALYAQLPAIRRIAGGAPSGLRFRRMTGAVKSGPLLFTRGVIKPLWNVSTPSALIDRFEVWVDGKLALAAPGTHRTAILHLPPGGHTVSIRALHLSGRTSTITTKVVSDATAPVFTAGPDVALRSGTLSGTVPIRLDWAAQDVNGLSAVRLLRPTAVDLGTTGHSRNGTLRPGFPATFTVQATDRAGNATSASVTRTPVVVSEAASQRTGSWRTLRDPRYLGGVALGSTAAGAAATWTFTGRSAALVVGRGAASGRLRISVDGADAGLVDLRSTATTYGQAVWSRFWGASGSHTVRVEVEGTAGRPGVVLDGLTYLT